MTSCATVRLISAAAVRLSGGHQNKQTTHTYSYCASGSCSQESRQRRVQVPGIETRSRRIWPRLGSTRWLASNDLGHFAEQPVQAQMPGRERSPGGAAQWRVGR